MMKLPQVVVLALACLGCFGCEVAQQEPGKPKKLVVGRVDTQVVLQSDPEYMTMAQDYLRAQTELRASIAKKAHDIPKGDPALEPLQKEYNQKQKELNKFWLGKTNEFLNSRHTAMQAIVAQICQDKGIDIVIIDSKSYTTVEWGAVDITQDVLLKTSGGSTPLPTGTGSPGK